MRTCFRLLVSLRRALALGPPRTALLAVVLLSCNFLHQSYRPFLALCFSVALSLSPLSLCLARSIAEKLAAFLAPPVYMSARACVCVCFRSKCGCVGGGCVCVCVPVCVRVRAPSRAYMPLYAQTWLRRRPPA